MLYIYFIVTLKSIEIKINGGNIRPSRTTKWGRELDEPTYGCIGVIDWGKGKGHVGFIVGQNGDNYIMLAVNHSIAASTLELECLFNDESQMYEKTEKYKLQKAA